MSKYDNRPFYKFQPTNPRDPQPTEATLLFDTPLEKEGNWGPYWIYKLRINGQEESVSATKALHNAIQNTGAVKGDTISVIVTGTGKDTRYDIINTKDAALYGDTPPPQQSTPAPQAPQRPAQATQQGNPKERFYDNMERYKVAWDLASDFLVSQDQTGDVNAIAFTFYKMAQDAGYDLLEDKGGVEFPDAAPF